MGWGKMKGQNQPSNNAGVHVIRVTPGMLQRIQQLANQQRQNWIEGEINEPMGESTSKHWGRAPSVQPDQDTDSEHRAQGSDEDSGSDDGVHSP